jgi:hypothetical protein
MHPAFIHWLLLFLGTLVAIPALGEVRVRVAEIDPGAPVALGRDEPLWVRIQFDADEPIQLWARPFLHGQAVKRTKSNVSAWYSGRGEALGWFSLDGAGEVDEIRIVAGGGKPYGERVLASYPVKATWTGATSAPRERAAWVDSLRRETEARFRQQAQEQASQSSPVADMALMSGFMLLLLALLAASVGGPAWALWKWRGGWRLAAMVPAAVMAFVVLRIVIDTARDPTSHNLWPFEILIWGGASAAAIGALALARRLSLRHAAG